MAGSHEVTGSNPVFSTIFLRLFSVATKGDCMNMLARNVKLSSILAFIAGILTVIGSIAFIIAHPISVNGYVCLFDSCILTHLGFQSARRINVPSQAYKIMNHAAVVVLIAFICAAFLLIDRNKIILEFIIGSVCLPLSLLVYVLARRMVVFQKKH